MSSDKIAREKLVLNLSLLLLPFICLSTPHADGLLTDLN